MGLKVGTVKLEQYNSEWEKMYEEERKNLSKLFGSLDSKIEHIGSTAVKGLSAKPVIDIAIGLKNLNDFKKVKSHFEKEPYSIKEDSVSDEILIRKGSEDNRTHFIHVMEINSDRYKNTIIFRDYLRSNPKALEEYENLKKDLSIKYADDRKLYTSSKNEFIQKVLNSAKKLKS